MDGGLVGGLSGAEVSERELPARDSPSLEAVDIADCRHPDRMLGSEDQLRPESSFVGVSR